MLYWSHKIMINYLRLRLRVFFKKNPLNKVSATVYFDKYFNSHHVQLVNNPHYTPR